LLLSDRIVPMTAGPAATMGPPVCVAIPKPRTAATLQHDDEALRVRTHVIECLTEYVKHARQRRRQVEPGYVGSAFKRTDGRPAKAGRHVPVAVKAGRHVRLESET
jgi:hypothetical protein